jgi:hypothetical protein
LGYGVHVDGNVAFESNVNPTDFINARVSLDYFSSKDGSKGARGPEQKARAAQLALALAKIKGYDSVVSSDD